MKDKIDHLRYRKDLKEHTSDSDKVATLKKEIEILKYELNIVEKKFSLKKDDGKFDLDLKYENVDLRIHLTKVTSE